MLRDVSVEEVLEFAPARERQLSILWMAPLTRSRPDMVLSGLFASLRPLSGKNWTYLQAPVDVRK
jgi:hypothetical protein